MCGRFTLKTPASSVGELFEVNPLPDLIPRYNVAPMQKIAIVRTPMSGDGREMAWARWGLVPSWAKDDSGAGRAINARSETAREKPTFRSSFTRRRCLVLADGFYEWKAVGKKKQPYYVRFNDGHPFAMAGLWDRWGAGAPPLDTCTILTTAASRRLASLHDRMPVILPMDRIDDWLSGAGAEELLVPLENPQFQPVAVSTLVNNVRHDEPDCIKPIEEDAPEEGSLF